MTSNIVDQELQLNMLNSHQPEFLVSDLVEMIPELVNRAQPEKLCSLIEVMSASPPQDSPHLHSPFFDSELFPSQPQNLQWSTSLRIPPW